MLGFGSYHSYLTERLSILRAACTTEAAIGQVDGVPSCFFMVGGSHTKGKTGIIPSCSFGNAIPLPMDDLEASVESVNSEQIIMGGLPDALVRSVNERISQSILSVLDGCKEAQTVEVGASVVDAILKSDVKLGENDVPIEDEDSMFCIIPQAMRSMLLEQTEFANGDYVAIRHGNRQYKVWRWAGKNWLVVPSGHSYIFHSHALGHALDFVALAAPGAVTGGIDAKTGTGWMKAKTKHLATVLQPIGIVRLVKQ